MHKTLQNLKNENENEKTKKRFVASHTTLPAIVAYVACSAPLVALQQKTHLVILGIHKLHNLCETYDFNRATQVVTLRPYSTKLYVFAFGVISTNKSMLRKRIPYKSCSCLLLNLNLPRNSITSISYSLLRLVLLLRQSYNHTIGTPAPFSMISPVLYILFTYQCVYNIIEIFLYIYPILKTYAFCSYLSCVY